MKYLLPVILFIALSACSSLKITTNYDSTFNFEGYKTYSYYGWNEESTKINPIDRQLIERAFASEFKDRGMTYDPSGQGDVVVSLLVVIESETSVRSYNDYYGGGAYGFHQPGWGYGYGYGAGYGSPYSYGGVTYEEYNYLTGTLVCDIFDRESKTLAWQGIASKGVESNIGKREKTIRLSVSRLMLKYPKAKLKK